MSGQLQRSRFAIVPMLENRSARYEGELHRRPDIEAIHGHQFEWSLLVDGGNDALILYAFDNDAYDAVRGKISDEKLINSDPAIIRAWAAPLMEPGEKYPRLDDVLGDKPQARDFRMAKASTLTDNFDDNSINTSLWDADTANSGTVTETGSQLECTAADNTDNSYGALISDVTYDLDESSFFVKVVQDALGGVGSPDLLETSLNAGEVNTSFTALDDDCLRIQVADEVIYYQYRVSGSVTDVASASYSDTTHLYWRIREESGTTYWDTSADGSSFTNRASVSTATHGLTHTALYLAIGMREYDPSSGIQEATAIFDDFNVSPVTDIETGLVGGKLVRGGILLKGLVG